MTKPTQPPPLASRSPWATHVLIPTLWNPEQALAVFDLLTDLRDAVASLYAGQIQEMLRQEQCHNSEDLAGDVDPVGNQQI